MGTGIANRPVVFRTALLQRLFLSLVLLSVCGAARSAIHPRVPLTPHWAKGGLSACIREANATFLAERIQGSVTPFGPEYQEAWVQTLLPQEVATRVSSRWGAALEALERKRQASTASNTDIYGLSASIRAAGAGSVMNELEDFQKTRGLKKAEEVANRLQKRHRELERPVAVAVTAAAVTTGVPITIPLSAESRLISQTDLRKRSGRFTLHAGKLESSLELLATPSVSGAEERYRIEVAREIPMLDLRGRLGFGGSTSLMTATVSKVVLPQVVCSLDSVQPVDLKRSATLGLVPDHRIRLDYELRF